MTSYASVTSAVEAMKSGAADYIAKPFDHDELVMLVDKVLREAERAACCRTCRPMSTRPTRWQA